jgi:trimeric autotransporter adhesin
VIPPPDGGYPSGNTAEGQAALLSLTTGGFNTAVGFFSLRSNIAGQFNTALGAGTLLANTADQNPATGAAALLSNIDGENNTVNGASALFANQSGAANTAVGESSMRNNVAGSQNTAVGHVPLGNNRTGANNVAIGDLALLTNSTGHDDTASGRLALAINNTGSNNTAQGSFAFLATPPAAATALIVDAGSNVTTENNVICIGTAGQNVSDSLYIANVFEIAIDPDNLPVRIDFTGRLGSQSSSRRFKDGIRPMDKASETLYRLKPVTFRFKESQNLDFGLIAEDVAEVDPNLAIRNGEGQIESVRYLAICNMMLNEFLKEHKKVQDLEVTVAQQQKGMEVLTAQLKEQAAQIQKVSAQIEVSKPAPQVVANKP